MRLFSFSRLFRYLFVEPLPYILLTLFILTSLILAQQVARQSDLLFGTVASTYLSFRLIVSLLPGILVITLPFSLLIGSLMGLNRLAADNEIIAARACGLNLRQIALPFILLGIIGTTLSGLLTIKVIPTLYATTKSLRTELITRILEAPLKPQTFNTQFANHIVYIQDIDRNSGEWLGVFIVRKTAREEMLVLTAQRGQLRMTQTSPLALEINLSEGLLLAYSPEAPEKQTLTSFQQQQIRLSMENPTIAQAIEKDRSAQELPLSQLTSRSQAASASPSERRQAQVEWHKRFSLPLACFILITLAVPIGISSSRHIGRAVAFTVGFIIAILYYLTLIAGQNFALSGILPAWFGIWLPNIVGVAVAFLRFFAPVTRSPRAALLKQDKILLKQRNKPPLSQKLPSRHPVFLSIVNYLLLSELVKYLLISLSILLVTSLIFTLFDLLPSLARSGLGWAYAGVYLIYLSPQILYYVAPFALLLAVLTAHGVLARSQQLTALVTSGIRPRRLLLPLIFCLVLIISATFWLSETILPTANQEQDARYNRIKGKKIELAVRGLGQYWVQGEDQVIYSYQAPPTGRHNTLLNTYAYKISAANARLHSLLFAREANQSNAQTWLVQHGWQYVVNDKHQLQFQHITSPESPAAQMTVPEGASLFRRIINEAAKMNFHELRSYVRYLSRLEAPTAALRVELEKKLAFPFSSIPLITLALALTLKHSRHGTLAGVGLSIIIGLSYWITASFFEGLGKQSYLPAGLSVWGPQALFMALGIYLAFRHRQ